LSRAIRNLAASVFHTLEDRLGEAESLRAWAHLDIAGEDFQNALKHLDKTIALFDDDSDELELLVDWIRPMRSPEGYGR
jgi:hypothetical protein